MKAIKQFLKKHWIALWIAVAIIGIASTVVYAEYIAESNRTKRVAANIAGAGQPFDSNYLSTGSPSISNIPFPSGTEGACQIGIKIWNYNRGNAQKAYKGPLTYDLIAQLVTGTGALLGSGQLGSYQIGVSSDGGSSYTNFSEYDSEKGYYLQIQNDRPFPPNASGIYEPTEHNYILSFPSVFLVDNPGIYVKVTAIPSDTNKLSELCAIFGVTVQEESLSKVWEGRFNEDTSRTDYDSFNYVITGSGEATITFSWCTDYLQVNSYNISDYGFSVTNTTRPAGGSTTHWSTTTFNANSNTISRYDFQLYMTTALENELNAAMSQSGATYTNYWNVMNQYIEFEALVS